MENITEKILVSSNYMDNAFHQCEEILDVPSECILLQNDVISNIEDAFLQMNILKQETSSLCSDQHSYFTTVSAFGDFISFPGDLVHKNDHTDESDYKMSYEENSEVSESVQEVVVEEVAEQEITSDPNDFLSCYDKIANENFRNYVLLPQKMNTLSALDSHQCDFCDRKFSKKTFLRRHRLLYHLQQSSFECSKCGAVFLRKKLLITHFKRSHSEDIEEKLPNSLGTNFMEEKYKSKGKPGNKFNKNKLNNKFFERYQNTSNNFVHFENGLFICTSCDETFSHDKDVLKHFCVDEINSNIYLSAANKQCEPRFNTFFDKRSLRSHRCNVQNSLKSVEFKSSKMNRLDKKLDDISKKEVIKESYTCDQSGYKCKSSQHLEVHLHQRKRRSDVSCSYNQTLYTNRGTAVEHLCKEHDVIPDNYVCTYCGKRCKDFRGLQKHSTVHSDGQFLICSICEKQFYTRTRLKRHMNSHRDKTVVCVECGEKVSDNRALANHRASHNLMPSRNGELATKIFPCHACSKVFGSRSSQQIHMRVHTGERPYNCRFCVKAFADGGTLRKHERIHTGEKPYVCPVCGKAFNQRVVLREHIRAHHANIQSSDGELNKCEVCAMIFSTPQELCTHLVKHSDENTAKHRIPLSKPRKYRKWKVKPLEENTRRKRLSRQLTNFNSDEQIVKLKCEDDSSLIFQNNEDDYEISTLNESIIKNEHDSLKFCNKLDDFQEVRLFIPNGNECLLPFIANETDSKKGRHKETVERSDKIFTIDVSYQVMNQFVDKLPENHFKNEIGDTEIDSDSCLNSVPVSGDKNGTSDAWFALKEKYEFPFDSDVYVHSGLGLGATVELQSEFSVP